MVRKIKTSKKGFCRPFLIFFIKTIVPETRTFGQGASFGDVPFWLCNKKCLDHTIIFYHGVNTFF